jgi:hypothetical protein
MAFLWSLEHKTQALLVGLALDAIKATSTALKAHFLGLSQADPIGRLIGTRRKFLCGIAIDMISNPAQTRGENFF